MNTAVLDAALEEPLDANAAALLARWPGPLGGLPPLAPPGPGTAAALEAAYRAAIAEKEAELRAIAENPAAPTFANTVESLEDSGSALRRVQAVFTVHAQTLADEAMRAVAQRIAPLAPALEDRIAHDERLFARIDTVFTTRGDAGLTPVQQRLVTVLRDRLLRRGAGLPQSKRERLAQINQRSAECFARFQTHLLADEAVPIWLDGQADLAGLNEGLRAQLAQVAAALGKPGGFALRNQRALVWPLLTQSTRRDLRERVWRAWTGRGGHDGAHDNRPVIREMLALRGEKAKLLGQPSFAHLQLADRMARTPEAAMAMLRRAWQPVLARTRQQIAEFQAVADAECDAAGEPHFELQPWDRLHYAEKLRQSRFGFDSEAMRPYLSLDKVFEAMFWSAGQLHGYSFHLLPDAPVCDKLMRVYEVRRKGTSAGVLIVDLFNRPGKGHGSYQLALREAEGAHGSAVLPISWVVSNLPRPAPGQTTLLAWEYANVFFHEFGHALHMLANASPYRSLGSLHVAWDFIELPSLLNERWLAEPGLLSRFARHHETGAPMPSELLQGLHAALAYDRIFSVNVDYLAPAIAELEMHRRADGTASVDPMAVEAEVLAELDMPAAWDPMMRMPQMWHAWSEHYAAGLYVYLWADVMAADAAEAFHQAGWYDEALARRFFERVLSAGNTAPADEAWRAFRGREPDTDALLRRFGLLDAAAAA